MRRRWRVLGAVLAVALLEPVVRRALRPSPPPPTAPDLAHAAAVEIVRDRWGVPHVFGHTDADTAFGLAYAHAEDDWPTIQGVLAASRGRLGLLMPGKTALVNDGYATLVDVEGEVARHWDELDPHTRDVFEAYARGLGFYAFHHPGEADARLLPFEGRDVARGFAHKLPLMLGLPDAIKALNEAPPGPPAMPGSNAHAVAPWRSPDGVSRLMVNSHQPWKGPVTWYEAQVRSDEGWDVIGGTFPGAPMILHGAAPTHGWALTVNTADRVDAYALDVDGDRYRYGDEWRPFETRRAWLPIETPWLVLWIPKTFRSTVHGPVLDTDHGSYALRHVGQEQGARAAEQWFRMNKATDLDSFRAAMSAVAIPMFNVVYADPSHVWGLYNARLPVSGAARAGVLSGSDPSSLWTDVLPLERLPQVLDPASGFVQACNSAPWVLTIGPENPLPSAFPSSMGIEDRVTARALRTLELWSDGAPIDRDRLLATKWDRSLAADAPMRSELLDAVRGWAPEDPDAARAAELLAQWDGRFEETSVGATIAVLAWRDLDGMGFRPKPPFDARARIVWAAAFLKEHHGRVEVPLGEVQRLRHGAVDLPLGGGPDTLNCTYGHFEDGSLVGDQGDSYVLLAEYGADGLRASSVHQYGASLRPESPHFSDQAPLFVRGELKPLALTREALTAEAERTYHPGE